MIGTLLKEKTKALHDQVEEKLKSQKIMDQSFSLQEYHQLLRSNYYFLLEFEEAVFANISGETKMQLHGDERRKLPMILKDLADFEAVKPADSKTVSIKNEAEALGIMYVMEGSTLGGNIIAKNLAKNPSFNKVSFNYFGFYGEKTGSLWKNFKEIIEEKALTADSQDFLDGANRAYRFLLDFKNT